MVYMQSHFNIRGCIDAYNVLMYTIIHSEFYNTSYVYVWCRICHLSPFRSNYDLFCPYPGWPGFVWPVYIALGLIHNGYPRGCGCCSPHQHHCCKGSRGAGQSGQLAVLSAVSTQTSSGLYYTQKYFQTDFRKWNWEVLLYHDSASWVVVPFWPFGTFSTANKAWNKQHFKWEN